MQTLAVSLTPPFPYPSFGQEPSSVLPLNISQRLLQFFDVLYNACYLPIPPILQYQPGILQFNSDTIYLEIGSSPIGSGLSPTGLSPLQMPVKSPGSHVTCASDHLAINQWFPQSPS